MRILLHVLLFLATVGLVSRGLDLLPRTREVQIDTEYEEFLAHRDEYDLLFFGSSRFYRGIIPERFDAVMRRHGTPVKSFNLGMRGMRSHETDELLRRALATRPARLRWIVVELDEWRPQTKNFWTDRAIAWHDWRETRSVLRSAWLLEEPLAERLGSMRINLLQFLARTFAVGVAAQDARNWFNSLTKPPGPEELRFSRMARQWRGFAPFTQEEYRTGPTSQHRRELLAQRDTYEHNVALLPKLNATDVPLASYNLPALQAQIEFARAAGVEIIYVIMPSFEPVPRLHRLAERGLAPHVLAFDDPKTWPKLYRIEFRFDRRHLNQKGAMEFTPLLAERISALIADE